MTTGTGRHMTRAERRRSERLAKKRGDRPLTMDEMPQFPTPERLHLADAVHRELLKIEAGDRVARELYRMCGDNAALERARNEGYEKAWKDLARVMSVNVNICSALAVNEAYGWKARPLFKLLMIEAKYFHRLCGAATIDELEEKQRELTALLYERTGLDFDFDFVGEQEVPEEATRDGEQGTV